VETPGTAVAVAAAAAVTKQVIQILLLIDIPQVVGDRRFHHGAVVNQCAEC
jgi:hypothetical protein